MFASVIEPAQQHLTKYFATKFFRRLAAEYGDCEFSVRFADGTNLASTPQSKFTLVIRYTAVLEKILSSAGIAEFFESEKRRIENAPLAFSVAG